MEKRKNVGGSDAIRINVGDSSELKYWAKYFGISPKEVRSAVEAVGDSLTAVKQHLEVRR
ncbi:DUF3606 domain-containing protein [Pseudomonas bohemica]|uniref:DUF3606 domain-containing protein n=1 Tax=Pseudomonas bohemica TaxID=2044872 RepID=UPI0018FE3CCF